MVVASLKHDGHSGLNVGRDASGQVVVASGGELHFSQWVTPCCVKPASDNYQVWLEPLSNGLYDKLVGRHVVQISQASRLKGYIHSVSLSLPLAHLVCCTRPREEVLSVPVEGDVENPVILVERVRDAVPVMHIPVDYHDAVDAVALKSRLCCDSTVVEEAEPHRTLLLGVVSRRPDQGKGILDAGIDNVHGRLDRAPRGHFRRPGCSIGIVDVRGSLPVVLVQVHAPFSEGGAVKLAPPWRYWHLHGLVRLLGHVPVHHGFDVLLGVHFSKLSGGREPGRDEPAAPHDPSRPQPLEGSPDPIRVLHVPLTGAGGLVHVIQHAVVMNDPRGLAVLALRVPPPLLPAAALADVLVGGHVAILLLCARRKEAHALVMKPLVAGVAREHRPGLVVGLLAHAVDLLLVPLVHQPLGVAPDQ